MRTSDVHVSDVAMLGGLPDDVNMHVGVSCETQIADYRRVIAEGQAMRTHMRARAGQRRTAGKEPIDAQESDERGADVWRDIDEVLVESCLGLEIVLAP